MSASRRFLLCALAVFVAGAIAGFYNAATHHSHGELVEYVLGFFAGAVTGWAVL